MLSNISKIDTSSEHFHVLIEISGKHKTKWVTAMIDSEASTLFLHEDFVWRNKVLTKKLKQPILMFNIDGTPNVAGAIDTVTILNMKIGNHNEKTVFTVINIGPKDVIIRID